MKEKSTAIEIKNLVKIFKKQKAVNDISFKVTTGTIHGFIGPNGSGKTTTIKCLIGAFVPKSGQLLINGIIATSPEAKAKLGYIPENARFPKHLNTYKYLVWMGYLRGIEWTASKNHAQEILKSIDLWKFRNKKPNNFSSGMKKKVLMAQALIGKPDILILDEPAANLDPSARLELFNELRRLRDDGKTILISSHILQELQHIVDEVTILKQGKVVYSGKIETKDQNIYIFDPVKPKEFVALLRDNNYDVKVSDGKILLQIKNDDELLAISKLALKHNILIKSTQLYITDLSELYGSVLSQENDQEGKESDATKPTTNR